MLASLSVLGCVALLSNAVWAEGAVRLLDCRVVRVCDAAGNCQAATEAVAFRMEPAQVGPDGAGRYQLKYDETEVAMEALSDAGPFVWTVGDEHNTLLVSSQTQLLWHRLAVSPVPAATVRFLECAIRQ